MNREITILVHENPNEKVPKFWLRVGRCRAWGSVARRPGGVQLMQSAHATREVAGTKIAKGYEEVVSTTLYAPADLEHPIGRYLGDLIFGAWSGILISPPPEIALWLSAQKDARITLRNEVLPTLARWRAQFRASLPSTHAAWLADMQNRVTLLAAASAGTDPPPIRPIQAVTLPARASSKPWAF